MSQLSLGIIETLGLATAIQVADICLKSSNVNLIGYEFAKGSGMTVIKIEGNVGAVECAVEAALASTNSIVCSKVIPRPNPEIGILIRNDETIGYKDENEDKVEELPKEVEEPEIEFQEIEEKQEEMETEKKLQEIEVDSEDAKKKLNKNQKKQLKIEICNICRDPKCTRKKGELINTCINYKGKDKGRN